jgi:hypothetical protein
MSIVGGSILELRYDNPDVGVGEFFGVDTETGTYILGGLVNKTDPQIDGGFNLIVEKMIAPGSIEMTVSNDMSASAPSFERAFALASSLNDTTWTFANSNGSIYKGVGVIVDTPTLDGNKSSFTLKIVSGKGFTQI